MTSTTTIEQARQAGSGRRAQALLLALIAGEAGMIAHQAAAGESNADSAKPVSAVLHPAPVSGAPWMQRKVRGRAGTSAPRGVKRVSVGFAHPAPVGP